MELEEWVEQANAATAALEQSSADKVDEQKKASATLSIAFFATATRFCYCYLAYFTPAVGMLSVLQLAAYFTTCKLHACFTNAPCLLYKCSLLALQMLPACFTNAPCVRIPSLYLQFGFAYS
jgi:hypothetical protein